MAGYRNIETVPQLLHVLYRYILFAQRDRWVMICGCCVSCQKTSVQICENL